MVVEGIAWLPLLLAGLAGYALSQIGQKGEPEVSGDYPEGEVLGEYPGGLLTFETLTPEQKKILQALMSYAMPKLGLPGQAFGQAPAGTTGQPVPWGGPTPGAGPTPGVGYQPMGGAVQGMVKSMMPMLTQLLGGGGSPSRGIPRGGGR